MANILVSMAGLVDLVHKDSYDLIIKNIDKVVEKYSSESKPLKLPTGEIIPHSNSLRYSNGELKPDYIEVTSDVIPKDNLELLVENNKQRLSMQKEIKLLINYVKITVHNAVLLANECNRKNPVKEIYWLVRQNIPEMVLNDTELINQCFPTQLEKDLLFVSDEEIKDTLTEEHIKEFKDKTTYPEAIEIFERFYTLRLLTNM